MEIIFKDQKIVDEFVEYLDNPEVNNKLMTNHLQPLFKFVESSSYKKMLSDYSSLIWKLNSGKFYQRMTRAIFLMILFGYNSLAVERQKPFKNITSFAEAEIYAKEVDKLLTNIGLSNILYALDLTPEKAVEYFEKKGIVISKDWKEALNNSRKHAFTISKLMDLDILKDFKAELLKAIKNGIPVAEFRKQIKDILAQKGWLGEKTKTPETDKLKLQSPWRLNLIYRQNVQTAFNQGRWSQAQETKATWAYIQFLSIVDKVTTVACRGLNNIVMSISDKQIKKFLPPGHFGCRRRFRVLNDRLRIKNGLRVRKGASILHLKNRKGFTWTGIGKYKPNLSKYPKELLKELRKK